MDEKPQGAMTCRRCGTCCQKGGPALHLADLDLVLSGNIPLASLYTLRKGELVVDNISGTRVRLTSEIVKIKRRIDSPACIYLSDGDMSCDIYDRRSLECRTLECWNTGPIERIYGENRLTRQDILGNIAWLAELAAAHEDECPLARIEDLVEARAEGNPAGAAGLLQMIRYDGHFRDLAAEKGDLGPDLLEFLLGRPLAHIIHHQFGVKINHIR